MELLGVEIILLLRNAVEVQVWTSTMNKRKQSGLTRGKFNQELRAYTEVVVCNHRAFPRCFGLENKAVSARLAFIDNTKNNFIWGASHKGNLSLHVYKIDKEYLIKHYSKHC